MDIHPTDIIVNIVHILVLFALLRLILWKPLYRFLSARTETVRKTLDSAEQAKRDAQKLKNEYEQKLEGLGEEGRALLRDNHIQAEEEAKRILAEANAKAETIIRDARVKIEAEKADAVAGAREEVAQLATDIAARILKREVSVSDTVAVTEDFFREMR